jgi:hypothetical protein
MTQFSLWTWFMNVCFHSIWYNVPSTARVTIGSVHAVSCAELHGSDSFLRILQSLNWSSNSPPFMEPESSLACSQEPLTWPYSKPAKPSSNLQTSNQFCKLFGTWFHKHSSQILRQAPPLSIGSQSNETGNRCESIHRWRTVVSKQVGPWREKSKTFTNIRWDVLNLQKERQIFD